MAPAAAPMASHLALRVIRRRRLPPLAARTASSRSRVKTAVLARSSVRSPWEAASLAGFAIEGEVVERLEIFDGEGGLGGGLTRRISG